MYASLISLLIIIGVYFFVIIRKKVIINKWNKKVNKFRLKTQKILEQNLTIAGKILKKEGLYFDVKTKKIYLPEEFWGLDPNQCAKILILIFKTAIKETRNNKETVKDCVKGLIEVLKIRAKTDPEQALLIMNIISSPKNAKPEDSIQKLLRE